MLKTDNCSKTSDMNIKPSQFTQPTRVRTTRRTKTANITKDDVTFAHSDFLAM